MARKLIGPKPGCTRDFVPRTFGNEKDDDPIVVTILQPTERNKREIANEGSEATFEVGDNGDIIRNDEGHAKIKMRLDHNEKRNQIILERFVTQVKNYHYAGIDITDGKLLSEHGESELVHEVVNEIMAKFVLTAHQKKLSDVPASLSPAVTDHCSTNAKATVAIVNT